MDIFKLIDYPVMWIILFQPSVFNEKNKTKISHILHSQVVKTINAYLLLSDKLLTNESKLFDINRTHFGAII